MTADAERIRQALEAAADAVSMAREVRSARTVTIEAGGLGLAVAVCCCVVMLSTLILGGLGVTIAIRGQSDEIRRQNLEIREIRRETQTMRDYLNVIYQQAPHLRPAEERRQQPTEE